MKQYPHPNPLPQAGEGVDRGLHVRLSSAFEERLDTSLDTRAEVPSAPSPEQRERAGVRALLPPKPTREAPPFPWREAMAIGFGRLRLSSREFWALTPRELAAAIEGLTGRTHAPMDHAAFDDLVRRYPD